ncbi:MAG: GNAT family N-acetyltransferase [Candidatus Rokubacteria bacterium]|nr:GNAT family N-acetyltransferase [Candidatus Rokubacteria bacterium]
MSTLPRDLGGGLVLRTATLADVERLVTFTADVLRFQDSQEPAEIFGRWTQDLLGGRHHRVRAQDAVLVEDRASGALVASTILISQTWTYGGVLVSVGQPELVGTLAAYRGRGLVRAVFEAIHAEAAARGHQLLAIAGIPVFYRQFGYEPALARGGGPWVPLGDLELPAPGTGPFRIRPARADDAGFLAATHTASRARYLVTAPHDERVWRYDLGERSAGSAQSLAFCVIETPAARPVGMLVHLPVLWNTAVAVGELEVIDGVSWRAVWPDVLAYLRATGEAYAARHARPFGQAASFWFIAPGHPLERIYKAPGTPRPSWWYLRAPDVAALLTTVRPALERHLADSPLTGHSGELRLAWDRGGVQLVLEGGRMVKVAPWAPARDVLGQESGAPSKDPRRPSALFPGLSVLQLLFGFRSVEELEHAFPDCVVRDQEARALLNALFPRRPSDVWALV